MLATFINISVRKLTLAGMKHIFTLFLLLTFHLSWAQTEIRLEDIASHVGDSIKVKGKISGARYLESANNTPTFINIGGKYPDQLLTIVIWGDVRKKFEFKPEEMYKEKDVCVTGKISEF